MYMYILMLVVYAMYTGFAPVYLRTVGLLLLAKNAKHLPSTIPSSCKSMTQASPTYIVCAMQQCMALILHPPNLPQPLNFFKQCMLLVVLKVKKFDDVMIYSSLQMA